MHIFINTRANIWNKTDRCYVQKLWATNRTLVFYKPSNKLNLKKNIST